MLRLVSPALMLHCLHFQMCPRVGLMGPVVGLFEVCLPWSVDSLMEYPEAVEARYDSFIQSSRSSLTRPLLDLLPLWSV